MSVEPGKDGSDMVFRMPKILASKNPILSRKLKRLEFSARHQFDLGEQACELGLCRCCCLRPSGRKIAGHKSASPRKDLRGLAISSTAGRRCWRCRRSSVRDRGFDLTPLPSNSSRGQLFLLPDFPRGGMLAKRSFISRFVRSELQIPTLSASLQNTSRSNAFNGRALAQASI